jgi:hypothetical protein
MIRTYNIGLVFLGTYISSVIAILCIFGTCMTQKGEMDAEINTFPYEFLVGVPFVKVIRTIGPEQVH